MRFQNSFAVLSAILAGAIGSVVPPSNDEDSPQCTGLNIDFTRLKNVETDDLDPISRTLGGREYGVNTIMPVIEAKTGECIKKRHRLQETTHGVPVFGAAVVVTVDDCTPPDETAFGGGYEQAALSGVPMDAISLVAGKTFSLVAEVTGGYVPSITKQEAIQALATTFGTTTDKISSLELNVFPSYEKGDLLSYRTEVWVSEADDVLLYDVFISAHTKEILSVCSKVNRQRQTNMRRLRKNRDLQKASSFGAAGSVATMCGSCADQQLVTWTTTEVECSINALYLNNENRTTTCLKGTVGGNEVLGPGIVSSLHYYGTYDCNQRESGCNANALPLTCSDALSDVHYGVTETLKFFQQYLGVMGGLGVNAGDPIKTASFVHFAKEYCNAFFTTQTNSLYFGDCDCQFWTPLTSIDVSAHELAHGVTNYASGLVYAYQPGGLNEAYSDIIGATMEYVLNDSKDTPDFNLGENLIGGGALSGFILRYMETPTKDGKSIDNVCSFDNEMNVHYTSGVPNKAFVNSVRACQTNGCGDERQCVMLMGPLYMYANIQGLTQLSGYLDAASATCRLSNEFMARGTSSSTCTDVDALAFVRAGWESVGVTLDPTCVATTASGCNLPTTPNPNGPAACLKWVQNALAATVGWLLSPFLN